MPQQASAVAGVMGGAISEVSDATTDLVIESAIFSPLSVRRTARKLKLHSPSSYRFERKVDPAGVDWASRRVCEMIVDIAGGSVADGVIDTAREIRLLGNQSCCGQANWSESLESKSIRRR